MLSEVLLLLSGHDSSLFVPHPSTSRPTTLVCSPHLTEYLHPGEITSLNSLADLAFKYRKIKFWSNRIQKEGKDAILLESLSYSRKGKNKEISSIQNGPNQYITNLAGSIIKILNQYEILIIEIESKILSLNPVLVQDNQGYVPLSSLIATFEIWKIPLESLLDLINQISESNNSMDPGKLIDLIEEKRNTGNSQLYEIYTKIYKSLIDLFLIHLISFVLYGITTSPEDTSKSILAQSLGLDIGADVSSPKYRIYQLDKRFIPSSIDKRTQESILYIGRVSATLKRHNKSLPKFLIDQIREEIVSVKGLDELNGFSDVIFRARGEVGEWLWKHILTGPQVIETIEFLSNYFFTRKSDFSLSLLREIHKLRLDKLVLSNPNSSSSVIREQDLNLAILRASVGTSAENDNFLDNLKFNMQNGPLRAIPSQKAGRTEEDKNQEEYSHTHKLFSNALLGTPINLTTSISWPLDLFLSPKSMSIYSDIHSYLFALRDTQFHLSNSWISITSSQRQFRNDRSNPLNTRRSEESEKLDKLYWGIMRIMNWFISELLSHFMDIIDIQHTHLLKHINIDNLDTRSATGLGGSISKNSLRGSTTTLDKQSSIMTKGIDRTSTNTATTSMTGREGILHSPLSESHNFEEKTTIRSNKIPPTPIKQDKNYLDFLTLRSIHSQHLSFLLEALLLSDPSIASLIRDILNTCKRFTGLIERWNGKLLFNSSEDENEELIKDKTNNMKEIDEILHDQILEFYSILIDSQNPPILSEIDKSSIETSKSFSKTSKFNQISKIINSRQILKGFSKDGLSLNSINTGSERHIEHLLLRLDFNGILTKWRDQDIYGTTNEIGMESVLPQGGL
ncbi:uncharacterized protein I206_107546 [Kwoniella pini CBS 10737]|uniref:Spindle pole body component n=1 Tax=Kwoniella pini CBS 10737 TaxID=1296096 RepID=A0A1B9HXN5_9TREE|nr:uncharacterized protein I206_05874 [Kwoniella pini CBS 10737]OCF48008.1 hypothetical protein I206_05874 [Kwoniella pini CBS 10737]